MITTKCKTNLVVLNLLMYHGNILDPSEAGNVLLGIAHVFQTSLQHRNGFDINDQSIFFRCYLIMKPGGTFRKDEDHNEKRRKSCYCTGYAGCSPLGEYHADQCHQKSCHALESVWIFITLWSIGWLCIMCYRAITCLDSPRNSANELLNFMQFIRHRHIYLCFRCSTSFSPI